MHYDFDRHIERRGSCSVKWSDEIMSQINGKAGLTPLWVADMDFACPQPVIDAVIEEARRGIYGYSYRTDRYFESFVRWNERRHGWKIDRDWTIYSSGVVTALNAIVQEFTEAGDKVIIQPPVYHPFFYSVRNNGRQVMENTLKELPGGDYAMDFESLQKMASDPKAKLAILCNPHNPVGRVWREDELRRFGEICLSNGILVVSDEIHSDLILSGHKHMPFATLSADFAKGSITCTAPSKTFNIAGLQVSNLIVPDEGIRKALSERMEANGIEEPNIFGVVAAEAAYSHGEEWLGQLLSYLEVNAELVGKFVSESMPGVAYRKPEGTYLAWLDFRGMGMDEGALKHLLVDKAGLALNLGAMFGSSGSGFARLNFGCPRPLLTDYLSRLASACRG
jgi:cystathionine beta-lyase